MSAARTFLSFCLFVSTAALFACSRPQPGPDKTIAGAILGAGWGAGAGAIVGNQVDNSGAGVAVGAGVGFLSGALTGASHDSIDGIQVRHENELASLKIQNLANGRELAQIQNSLDEAIQTASLGGVYQVFFDSEETNLRAGSVANLEVIADSLRGSPYAYKISVAGHTDDSGNPTYNQRLAEARARNVSAYLMARGISADQIIVKSFGAERPIASNGTPVGRQLNRRVDVYVGK